MTKNTWNYRVMIDDTQSPTYSIHEVYYHEDGSPEDYTKMTLRKSFGV